MYGKSLYDWPWREFSYPLGIDQNNLQADLTSGQAFVQSMLLANDWLIETAGAIEQMTCCSWQSRSLRKENILATSHKG